jgi:hypothetical protein
MFQGAPYLISRGRIPHGLVQRLFNSPKIEKLVSAKLVRWYLHSHSLISTKGLPAVLPLDRINLADPLAMPIFGEFSAQPGAHDVAHLGAGDRLAA